MSAISQKKVNGLLILKPAHLDFFLLDQDQKQIITIVGLLQCTITIGVHHELIVNPTGAESSYANITYVRTINNS